MDAVSGQRPLNTVASFQREFVAFTYLLQIQTSDYVLTIEVVQVKVFQSFQDEANDDVFGANEKALAVGFTRRFERVNPDCRLTGPM